MENEASELLKSLERTVAEHRLFGKNDRLLVACSGGLDSTVLAHALIELGYTIGLAHVNYGLRGEDSSADEASVRRLSEDLRASTYVPPKNVSLNPGKKAYWMQPPNPFGLHVHASSPAEIESLGGSLQMAARMIRRKFFARIADLYEYDCILTAHHAKDSLETTLINLARRRTLPGALGIPPRRGRNRRPLIFTPHRLLREYAKQHGLYWREDSSNAKDDYLRNRVRHHVLPVLRDHLNLDDEGWGEHGRLLQEQLSVLKIGYQYLRQTSVVETEEGFTLLPERLPEKLRTPAQLRHLLIKFIGFPAFSPELIRQVTEAKTPLRLTENGRELLRDSDGNIVWGDTSFEVPLSPIDVTELPFSTLLPDGRTLELAIVPRPRSLVARGELYLRSPLLSLEPSRFAPLQKRLHLRPRQNGDRWQPFGLEGTKKLQDYFVDRKVPRHLRDRTYLLVQGEEILAVIGHGVSELARVGDDDREVLRIRLLPPTVSDSENE